MGSTQAVHGQGQLAHVLVVDPLDLVHDLVELDELLLASQLDDVRWRPVPSGLNRHDGHAGLGDIREPLAGHALRNNVRVRGGRLTRLEMFSAPVGDDDVAQFAALHPSATILHRWHTALVTATAGANSVRVRTGGTCHRHIEDEAVLFELTGAAEVRALLDRIAIDEPSSGEHCLCCGDPSIEITDGANRIAVTLGMHHGRRLRWPGGWPGDGELTGAAATAVCRWLADHGHPESLHQLEDPARIAEGKRRLLARYRALVPLNVAAGLTTVDSYDEARIAMDRLQEAPARAELLVRLLGAHAWPWSDGPGDLDRLVGETLNGFPVAEVHGALSQVVSDLEGRAGVARWLYDYQERWKELPRAQLDPLVAATAPWALGHCQRQNRVYAIACLLGIGGTPARDALRLLLAGAIQPWALPPDAPWALGGGIRVPETLPQRGSDRAYAGWVLARLGDRESAPAIGALAATATPADARVLAEAMTLLEAPAK